MARRAYTLSDAALAARRAAARKPRGGTREWTSIRVSADVLTEFDRQRGDRSRNDHLASLLGMPPA